MRRLLTSVIAIAGLLALAWAAVIWLTGGLTLTVAGMRVSATTAWRPLAIGVAFGALGMWMAGFRSPRAASAWIVAHVTPARCAIALAVMTAVAGLAGNSWTASGPDPFAYVSQAALWRTGRLDLPVPLAADVPWPDAVSTFAPFGYRPAPHDAPALVPITAPGVPMLMAVLQRIAGHWAAFLVTPLAGGALVLVTFAIGRRVRSPATGLIAAWLVATSPALLYNLMWPMADVPAALCAGLMIGFLLSSSVAAVAGAGLSAAVGTLVRPNFIVIALGGLVWLVFAERRSESLFSRIAVFAAMLLPAVATMLWLNARWFGSPLASGYGTAGNLFSIARVGTNVSRYGRWLLETSPLALVGLGALMVPLKWVWPVGDGRRTASLLAISIITACGVYLLYQTFNDWWYLRFLLPAWPALFVSAAAALDAFADRQRRLAIVTGAVVIAAGIYGVSLSRERGVFTLGEGERRYVTIARIVDRHTEPSAVILTWQHSGTVLYYAGRDTVRFDLLDSAWLDRAVAWLAEHGRHPYILIEDWEQPIFEARFGARNRLGHPSAPAVVWQSSRRDGYVWLFDPIRPDTPTQELAPDVDRDQPLVAAPAAFPKYD
jgi:hypothetical protein